MALSVERRKSTVSSSGMPTLSFNTSTAQMARTVLCALGVTR
jgi:hypothetical protein